MSFKRPQLLEFLGLPSHNRSSHIELVRKALDVLGTNGSPLPVFPPSDVAEYFICNTSQIVKLVELFSSKRREW